MAEMQRAVYFDSLSTVRSEKNVSTVFTDHTLESEACLKGRIFMDNHICPFLWMRGECLEARPHDDFCGPLWWRDMDIVLDEAQKYGMNVWILDDRHFPTGYANGGIEKHPERKKLYLACSTSDIFGKKGKHTLDISRMLKPSIGYWDIGKPVDYAERANNRLFAILALPFAGDDIFEEKVLDLTDSLRTNPADSVRTGLDLDSFAIILKKIENLMLLNKKMEFNDITYCYSFIVQRTILRRILAS